MHRPQGPRLASHLELPYLGGFLALAHAQSHPLLHSPNPEEPRSLQFRARAKSEFDSLECLATLGPANDRGSIETHDTSTTA